MHGLGTLINTLAVIFGGLIGMKFKAGLSEKMQSTLMQACGISTIFIGAAGTLSKMLVIENGRLSTTGSMILILSLVGGGALGEWIDLEARMDRIGERLKALLHREEDNLFVDGFVNVSLVICVGAMAIVGSIQDGISGDYSLLTAKAILDLIITMVFASTYGLGAVCSAIAIFLYQGTITLIAMLCGFFASEALISVLSFVGSSLIACVGINICFGKKIRVGNLLPALLFAPLLQLFFA